jgi:hypothetical protein
MNNNMNIKSDIRITKAPSSEKLVITVRDPKGAVVIKYALMYN